MHVQDNLKVIPSIDQAKVIVEGFSLEDFLGAEGKPYAWLYSFSDNAYTFNVFSSLLAAQAKRLKLPNYVTLRNAYEAVNRVKTPQSEALTAFTEQDMPLACGSYTCNDRGVFEPGFDDLITVCPHPIMPVERLINIESGEVKTRLAYKRGTGWRKPVFDKATLSSARNIVSLASCGIGVTSESAKSLVKYLAYMEDRNYDALPETKMVERLGWIDGEGFSPYIDGVVYDSSGQFDEEYKAIGHKGSYATWKKLAREVRVGESIPTRIALAASFASPLVKLLDALPFICHVWGSVSGIGKSVALILAASVWANPEIGYYVKTTKATDVALEQLAFFTGNMPLCLDELQLIQGAKEGFDKMVYSLCEGIGKSRGSKTGGLQQVRRWRNSIITTGEQPITASNSKAGAVNRVIEVEVQDKTFPDPREAYQTLIHNYGHAGRDFVHQIQQGGESLIEELKAVQKGYYEALEGKATEKQVLTASIILAADYLAEKLIFHDGVTLTEDDILPFLRTRESADTNGRAYEWLCDWIASNPRRFTPNGDIYEGECWGKLEKDADDNPVRALIIRSVFNRAMNDAGFSPQSFLSWADKQNLVGRSKGHFDMARRVIKGGPLVRCVALNLPQEEPEFVPTQEETPFR